MGFIRPDMAQKSATTLPCAEETRKRVKSYKSGGEPYDDVLRRMCDAYEEQQKDGGSA